MKTAVGKKEKSLRIRQAMQRRKNPHPAHRALAKALEEFPWLKWDCEDQAQIGPYFPDFRFFECGLIAELDGTRHLEANDRLRDEHLGWNNYSVLRFPSDQPTEEIVQEILAFAAKNAWLCHRCRKEPRTGKRYCTGCGQILQDVYRTKQLGQAPKFATAEPPNAQPNAQIRKPARQFTLWPACRDCSGSGWINVDSHQVRRCACRKQMPLIFDDEIARDREKAAQEAYLRHLAEVENAQQLSLPNLPVENYEQFRLRIFTLMNQKSLNRAVGLREPERNDRPVLVRQASA